MKSINYTVIIEPFAERHYIKLFSKKYRSAWDITFQIIKEEFSQVDLLFPRNIAETVVDGTIKICKTEFKIAGTDESRHGSGNRCIIAINVNTKEVCVLLIYSKTDLSGHNETAEWKRIIRNNYPIYKNI